MKKKYFNSFLIVLSTLLFSSCGGNFKTADTGYYFEDFDNLKMWSRDQLITSEQAHSGNFSTYTDSNHEFSQTFEMDFNYAKSKGYKNMHLAAWCYLTAADTKAGLVASVESPAKSLSYGGADLTNAINEVNQWKKVDGYIKFPQEAPEGTKIKVYLWSPHKQKIFIDDIEIQFSN